MPSFVSYKLVVSEFFLTPILLPESCTKVVFLLLLFENHVIKLDEIIFSYFIFLLFIVVFRKKGLYMTEKYKRKNSLKM